LVTVRKFSELQKAEFYALALRNCGIPAVINHSLFSSLLPIGQIELCVNRSQIREALEVINDIELNEKTNVPEDFREADLEEIIYQKELNHRNRRTFFKVLIFVVVIILAVLLTQYLRWSYGML
jgi:hypothetical protein